MNMTRTTTWIFLLLALAGCASKNTAMWRAVDIEAQPTAAVRLVHDGQSLGQVNREQIKLMNAVKDRLEKVVPGVGVDLYVQAEATPNAFASSSADGKNRPLISITLGMIELVGWDSDAYAAVLGHEFAHLALRHNATRQQRRTVTQAASTALGLVLSAAGVPMGGTVADIGVTVVERTYSREEETQADQQGFAYLVAAGYDPAGAVRLWQKMQAAQKTSTGFSIPFLSTHPLSQERIETMEKLAAGQIPGSATAATNRTIQKSR